MKEKKGNDEEEMKGVVRERKGLPALASTPPGMPGTHPPNILVGGDVNGNIPANIITYFWI